MSDTQQIAVVFFPAVGLAVGLAIRATIRIRKNIREIDAKFMRDFQILHDEFVAGHPEFYKEKARRWRQKQVK